MNELFDQRPKDVPLVVELPEGTLKSSIIEETKGILQKHPEYQVKRITTGEWVDTLTPTHAFFEDLGYRYPNNKRYSNSIFVNLVKNQVFIIEHKVF
jgi:hypothetical protein